MVREIYLDVSGWLVLWHYHPCSDSEPFYSLPFWLNSPSLVPVHNFHWITWSETLLQGFEVVHRPGGPCPWCWDSLRGQHAYKQLHSGDILHFSCCTISTATIMAQNIQKPQWESQRWQKKESRRCVKTLTHLRLSPVIEAKCSITVTMSQWSWRPPPQRSDRLCLLLPGHITQFGEADLQQKSRNPSSIAAS